MDVIAKIYIGVSERNIQNKGGLCVIKEYMSRLPLRVSEFMSNDVNK